MLQPSRPWNSTQSRQSLPHGILPLAQAFCKQFLSELIKFDIESIMLPDEVDQPWFKRGPNLRNFTILIETEVAIRTFSR